MSSNGCCFLFSGTISSAWEAQYALAAALLTGQGMDKARGLEQNSCNFDGQINGYEDDMRPLGRWWFQICFIFIPKIGEDDPILTCAYFSNGW